MKKLVLFVFLLFFFLPCFNKVSGACPDGYLEFYSYTYQGDKGLVTLCPSFVITNGVCCIPEAAIE